MWLSPEFPAQILSDHMKYVTSREIKEYRECCTQNCQSYESYEKRKSFRVYPIDSSKNPANIFNISLLLSMPSVLCAITF